MNFKSFVFYTSLGSGIWVMILAALGWFFGANQELLARYYKEISLFFIFIFFAFILFIIFRKNKKE